MKDFTIVAKFTAKEMLKRKSFLISNLIIILIIIVGFNIPNIINNIKGNNSEESLENILIVDSSDIYGKALDVLNQAENDNKFQITHENISKEQIKEKIDNNEIESAIIISLDNGNVKLDYVVDSLGMGSSNEEPINMLVSMYKNMKLADMGFSAEKIVEFNNPVVTTVTELKEGSSGSMLFVAMMLSIVLFYAIYFCAYQVSSSITTEKTSKIMETLVTSTSPRTIVLGKTIGIGIVGLLQVISIVAVALICAYACLPKDMLSSALDLSQITPTLGVLTVIYFILGYATYALLYALTGSTVSKPEDVQSANGPVAIIAVIGFYLAYFTMMNPTSDLNVFASIFPFSAPFCMPFRVMMGVATPTQIAISIIVLLLTILVVASVSIKIYSNAILNYGSRVSLKDMIKMYKNK